MSIPPPAHEILSLIRVTETGRADATALVLRSPVICLLFACGPAAIIGLVIAVDVNAVECEARCWLAHIGKEIDESQPSFTDYYASSTIVAEGFVLRIAATLEHGLPRDVSLGLLVPFAVPVFPASLKDLFFAQAAARTGIAGNQAPRLDDTFATAIAFAEPMDSGPLVSDSQSDQPSEALTCDIFESGHRGSSYERRVKWRAGGANAGPLRSIAG
jgi:hypothetical protein